MIKFQMESQQKNEEKILQLQKENEENILKNEEKTTTVLLELQKQQEALFKNLSNKQPTDSTTILTQNFNTGRLVTTKNNNPALATAVEKYIGPRAVPIGAKNVKTAINSDIIAHSVETEK